MHTVPFTGDFRLHVRTGIRRWCTNGPVKIGYRHSVSTYLLTETPWLQGGPGTGRFAVSQLCNGDAPDTYEWTRGGPEGMLRQLMFAQQFPEPAGIQAAPATWIDGAGGVTAGVVYSTLMGTHGVGAGLMPRDRAPLSEWIAPAFEPFLRRVPDHHPSKYPVAPRNLPRKPTGKTAKEKDEKKAQIQAAAAAGPQGRPGPHPGGRAAASRGALAGHAHARRPDRPAGRGARPRRPRQQRAPACSPGGPAS